MQYISVINASVNNLKNVTIKLPLNQWISFVGKSGSGKSTLADVILRGSMSESESAYVPVETALFKQKIMRKFLGK